MPRLIWKNLYLCSDLEGIGMIKKNSKNNSAKRYKSGGFSDFLREEQLAFYYPEPIKESKNSIRVLSLFSGCGGMDLGFEGRFIANMKSFPEQSPYIEKISGTDWVITKKTRFSTVFANDILIDAAKAWLNYMRRFGHDGNLFRTESIVELVKQHKSGAKVFPNNVDLVVGGFPCQDFSVAGKRMGFDSLKDDKGCRRTDDKPSEETRGKLYYWMKQVIDITKPKMFVAENVKGLVNLGNVKDIIQRDFESADGGGYIVLDPQVLHAGNFGVPESRERVIFIGIRKDALNAEARAALGKKNIPEEYNPYPRPTHSIRPENHGLLPFVRTYDVLRELREPDQTVDESQKNYSKAKFLSNNSQGQTEIRLDGLGPTIRSEHHGNIEFRRLSKEHGGMNDAELKKGMKERRLTPRECALIQSFPPDYEFVKRNPDDYGYYISPSSAYRIIGNAVPPVLAYNIAIRIESLWDVYFGRS
ncbi:MAG: DNA cytosine methyltransferase [Candidatus Egerieousia sp.]